MSDFLSPYDPTIAGRDKEYENGAPQMPMFWDKNGFSPRPFPSYYVKVNRGVLILISDGYIKSDEDKRRYIYFFVKGWEYKSFDFNINLPGKKSLILKFLVFLLTDIYLELM